jgi:RNA recognition motif-containing protein
MRSETQQTSHRRRGGRRHQSNGSYRSSSEITSPSKAPAKLGFFGRILAFFTGKKNGKKPVTDKQAGSPGVITIPNRSRINEEAEVKAQPKVVRKPELIEVTSPKVYVGNLSFDATESDLSELFAGVGAVQNSEVVSHRETHRSKGFAFVTLASVDEAKRAVIELHDKEFMGRKLVVSGAKTNDVRDTR